MNETDTGPLVTEAMVCPAKCEPLLLTAIVLPPLTVNQVEVDIDFCGLCHTDIHMKSKTVS
jgi:D-arabinose 1-dehydrogenase-like Zn-dependent alcohol dehydrogenase